MNQGASALAHYANSGERPATPRHATPRQDPEYHNGGNVDRAGGQGQDREVPLDLNAATAQQRAAVRACAARVAAPGQQAPAPAAPGQQAPAPALFCPRTFSYQLKPMEVGGSWERAGRTRLHTMRCDMAGRQGGQRSAISGQLSAVGGQLSAVSCQRSAVSGQLSAVSCQLSAVSCQRSAVSALRDRETSNFSREAKQFDIAPRIHTTTPCGAGRHSGEWRVIHCAASPSKGFL